MQSPLPYLTCFTIVAETGNLSRAARQMGLSQPSVSRQIRLLEERLGVDLFLRDNTGVRLTESGKMLEARLTPLWSQIQDIVQTMQEHAGQTGGLIRFGCLTEIGQTHFMERIVKFRTQFPDVVFHVAYLKEFEILQALREGELDFGILTSAEGGENITVEPLLAERIVVTCRSAFRQDLESITQLRNEKFIAYRPDDPLLMAWIKKHFGRTKVSPQIALTVNSHKSMIDALLSADSYAVMPWQSVDALVNAGMLRVASSRELRGHLHLANRSDRALVRRESMFREWLFKEGPPS